MRIIVIGLLVIFSGSAAGASPDEVLRQVFAGIEKECNLYAEIVNEAHWIIVEEKLNERGVTLPDPSDYKQSMLNLHSRQCVIVQSIGILRELESTLSSQEWLASGGSQSIHSLQEELQRTIRGLTI